VEVTQLAAAYLAFRVFETEIFPYLYPFGDTLSILWDEVQNVCTTAFLTTSNLEICTLQLCFDDDDDDIKKWMMKNVVT
jgi:hypothetical protein